MLVAGRGFVDTGDDLRCRVAATVVAARWLSAAALECDAPPLLDKTVETTTIPTQAASS